MTRGKSRLENKVTHGVHRLLAGYLYIPRTSLTLISSSIRFFPVTVHLHTTMVRFAHGLWGNQISSARTHPAFHIENAWCFSPSLFYVVGSWRRIKLIPMQSPY